MSKEQVQAVHEYIDRIVRPNETRRILGVSKATLWRMVQRKEISPPLRISKGAVGWRASTIASLLEQREREAAARGAGDGSA